MDLTFRAVNWGYNYLPGFPGESEDAAEIMDEGLTTADAQARLERFGPNAIPEEQPRPIFVLLKKLWGPVPWMLEASFILELVIGRYTQASIVGILLIFNAFISYLQESRAQNALKLLRSKLSVQVIVRRDGVWQTIPAQSLVPDDMIHMKTGNLVPADIILLRGSLSVDQSALTGESMPVDVDVDELARAGGLVTRGEADARVMATGARTFYGKTAELVRTAETTSILETTILGIVRYLVALDVLLVIGVLLYSWLHGIPYGDAIPFALMLLVASVPVALPATFTLASALGAKELAAKGVLVTRLPAIEEAAAMDVLCSDKTGTITENRLKLSVVWPYQAHTEEEVLRLAALGSNEASQDPIDLAILRAARERKLPLQETRGVQFLPFDPKTKRTESVARVDGTQIRVVKGYPRMIAALDPGRPDPSAQVEQLAEQGNRVIGIAAAAPEEFEFVGLVGLSDPPRPDSRELIEKLQSLGVRVVMVTGDSRATARAIAEELGLGDQVYSADELRKKIADENFDGKVVAGVLPEDKFLLVQGLQHGGHVVGMTGDGVNDAPALRQAQVGIAVSNATDVARAAASAVLTQPGLGEILSAVQTGRQIYQRMLTYTLNKIVKTFQIALFLSIGLFLTGGFITTPRLVVLLLFANDFVTMALASDRVSFSHTPDRWQIKPLIASALVLAAAWLGFSFGVLYLGQYVYRLDLTRLQTLAFVMLVFSGQANVYLVRERGRFWKSAPSNLLLWSSLGDVAAVVLLATAGILMTPISVGIVAAIAGLTAAFAVLLDFVKVPLFQRIGFEP